MTDTSTEIVVPGRGDVEAAAAPSAALVKMRADFREQFATFPWVDQSESGAMLALQILSGDPTEAGGEIESRSVRNLRLVNKVHTVTEVACAESTFGEQSAGPDFYLRVSAVDLDGAIFQYSIGGWIPMAQLAAKFVGGLLPWRCQITAQPSRQGNPAYRYVDA